MKNIFGTAVIALLVAASPCFAQTQAEISFVAGRGFFLISNGDRTAFDFRSDDVIGLPMRIGDQILVDDESYLELTFDDGRGVVKLAENTVITFADMSENGGGFLRVDFGRIRVVVPPERAEERLWITGSGTAAGILGADFGYDVFYDRDDPEAEKKTAVYCFDGEVEVLQADMNMLSKVDLLSVNPFLLNGDKMVRTDKSTLNTELQATPIDQEIIDFWDAYKRGAKEPPVVTEDLDLGPEPLSPKYIYGTGGRITFAFGIGLMTAGTVLFSMSQQHPHLSDAALGLLTVGSVTAATGTGMMLYSFSFR